MVQRLFQFALFGILFFLPIKVFSQYISFAYKGAWSEWQTIYLKGYNNYFYYGDLSEIYKYSDNSGCSLKTEGGITYFDFQINNYRPPSNKEIKQHLKDNIWYEYTGKVSYYVSDDYPTADELAKNNTLVKPNPRTDNTPRVKRTAEATIKIAPYKKEPQCYNIFFDNIGIGISISGLKFKR